MEHLVRISSRPFSYRRIVTDLPTEKLRRLLDPLCVLWCVYVVVELYVSCMVLGRQGRAYVLETGSKRQDRHLENPATAATRGTHGKRRSHISRGKKH